MTNVNQPTLFPNQLSAPPRTVEYIPPDIPAINQYAETVCATLYSLHRSHTTNIDTRRGFANFIRSVAIMVAKQKSTHSTRTIRGGNHG